MSNEASIRASLSAVGQEQVLIKIQQRKWKTRADFGRQVLKFWDKLSPEEQSALLQDIEQLDVERAVKVFQETMSASPYYRAKPSKAVSSYLPTEPSSNDNLAPLPTIAKAATAGEKSQQWRNAGLEAAAQGKLHGTKKAQLRR